MRARLDILVCDTSLILALIGLILVVIDSEMTALLIIEKVFQRKGDRI